MRFLFVLAILLGSFLLFLIQPMAARIILPAFGGTPAVWTGSVVFFQAVLLLGYGYAHLAKRPPAHLALMGLALFTLPFATKATIGAQGQTAPVFSLLMQLALMVGPVFFVVSAGSPLIQRWFAATNDPDAKDPYFLYSASNIGSMAALFAYPLLVEPNLNLSEQTKLWAGGYAALVALMATVAWLAKRNPRAQEETTEAGVEVAAVEPVRREQRALWVLLAAVPSSLLLGVTTYLSSNIAPVPLLWVVPLALFLLTFILVFARRTFVTAAQLGRIVPLLVTPLALAIILESTEPLLPLAVFHLGVFFLVAWMCHARLSESRPAPAHLTEFYFWMSVGGVVGGAFNAIVAPAIFGSYLEYPLALVVALLLRPATGQIKPSRFDLGYAAGVAALTLAIVLVVRGMGMEPTPVRTILTIGLPAVLAFLAVDRVWRYGLALGGLFLVSTALNTASDSRVILTERSFYGVHRVTRSDDGRFFRLVHGNTTHGVQDRENPTRPLTYYHPTGPIGNLMQNLPAQRFRKIALVGLGVGSLAAYGQPGDKFTYFEIDPTVEKIARDPRLFTFLRDSKAEVKVVLGDARLTLGQDPENGYDLIVLDAFSSDAIPVHLLTREAAQMYVSKLNSGGILAYHISNRYLDLGGVLGAIARELKLHPYRMDDGPTTEEEAQGKTQSIWMFLARDKDLLGPLVGTGSPWQEVQAEPGDVAWTDDFSNVLGVVRRE